jgi:hypothetical protein
MQILGRKYNRNIFKSANESLNDKKVVLYKRKIQLENITAMKLSNR